MANKTYNENYANFGVGHNAMLAFLKTWERKNKAESLQVPAEFGGRSPA
jgi:hypothetical protein